MLYDVIIVGGGPAGLSAALLLARACRRVVVIDAGQPRNAAARQLHGFLTRDPISPRELLQKSRADLARYDVELHDAVVTHAAAVEEPELERPGRTSFVVEAASGQSWQARKLLFATGMRDELPPIPGFQECYGASIHHCPYCDGFEHRGQRLLAYGCSPSAAAGLGLLLKNWSSHVTVLSHGETIDAQWRERLRAQDIAWCEEPIERALHAEDRLEGIVLASGERLPADALFFNTSQRPSCELTLCMGVARHGSFSGATDDRQRTNVPGVFVAGDADGDVQFAIVAAAEGAKAAVAINRELQDEDRS